MYDLYPEWGPSKNRNLVAASGPSLAPGSAVTATAWPFDARDDDDQRPDDN